MRDAVELLQPSLSEAPEAFDAVSMGRASDELIYAMIDSEVLNRADINQAIIATPPITVDDSFGSCSTANNGLQRGFFAVRDDLRVDAAVAFEDPEDNSLARGSSPALATHAASAEVRFIDFHFARREGRGTLAFLRDTFSDFEKDHSDAFARQAGQLGCSTGCQIERKVTQHAQEFTLTNFGTPAIAI